MMMQIFKKKKSRIGALIKHIKKIKRKRRRRGKEKEDEEAGKECK